MIGLQNITISYIYYYSKIIDFYECRKKEK